jgi:hypothetical protein
MTKIYLQVLATLIAASTYGQKNEYLVKQNGDTLYGDIEFRNKAFVVNSSGANSSVTDAADVKRIHSKNFKGNVVLSCHLNTYIDVLTELMPGTFKTTVLDTVMVLDEIYSTPKINLYFSKDYLRRQYYFIKTPSDPDPVQLYVNYAISGENHQNLSGVISDLASAEHIVVQKGYVNQLRAIMLDCKNISAADWEALDYRDYSLKAVIKKYNKCK